MHSRNLMITYFFKFFEQLVHDGRVWFWKCRRPNLKNCLTAKYAKYANKRMNNCPFRIFRVVRGGKFEFKKSETGATPALR